MELLRNEQSDWVSLHNEELVESPTSTARHMTSTTVYLSSLFPKIFCKYIIEYVDNPPPPLLSPTWREGTLQKGGLRDGGTRRTATKQTRSKRRRKPIGKQMGENTMLKCKWRVWRQSLDKLKAVRIKKTHEQFCVGWRLASANAKIEYISMLNRAKSEKQTRSTEICRNICFNVSIRRRAMCQHIS